MAEANTNSAQQAQDAQNFDNLTSLQQGADQGAGQQAGAARADANVTTSNPNQPDNPSLYNDAKGTNNNQPEFRAKGNDSVLETTTIPNEGRSGRGNETNGPNGTGTFGTEVNVGQTEITATVQYDNPDIRGNNGEQGNRQGGQPTGGAQGGTQGNPGGGNQPTVTNEAPPGGDQPGGPTDGPPPAAPTVDPAPTPPAVDPTPIPPFVPTDPFIPPPGPNIPQGQQPTLATPELSIVKEALPFAGSDGDLDVGDVVRYAVAVTNIGNTSLTDFVFTDAKFDTTNGEQHYQIYKIFGSDPTLVTIENTFLSYLDSQWVISKQSVDTDGKTVYTRVADSEFNLAVGDRIIFNYDHKITQAEWDARKVDNYVTVDTDQTDPTLDEKNNPVDDPASGKDGVAYKSLDIVTPEMTIAKTVTAVNLDGNHYGSPQAKDTTALDVDSAGDQIKYTLTLENTGNVEVDTIAVKDSMFKLNTGATAIRATDIEYAIDVDGNGTETWKAIGDAVATLDTTTGQLSFNNLTLGVNQNIFVRYNVLVTQDDIDTNGGGDGFIDNVASAKYDDVQDGSGTPKEALDKDPSDSDNEVSYKIPIIRSPEMTIAKTVTAVNLDGNHYGSPQAKDTTALDVDSAGDQIKYTLTLENTGNVEVDTIAVKDSMFKLNTGATAIRATDIEYAIDVDGNGTETWKAIGDAVATLDTTTGQLSFNNLTLGVNQNIFVRYNVLVTQDDIDTNGGGDGFIDNVASAKYDDVQDGSGTPKEALDKDPSDSDNEVSYKIPIIRSPEMTIAKTVTAVNLDGNHYGSPQAKDTTALDVDSAGDQIKYTLTLENTGNVEVDTIAVKDSMFKLNTGATAIRATDIEYAIDVDGNGTETWKAIGDAVATLDTTTGQLSFNNLTLGVNQNIFVRYNVLVTQDDIDTNGGGDGFIDNVASAKYDDVQDGSGTPKEALDKDPSDSDNEVSYKIPIIRSPEMTIAKTVTAVNLDGNHYGSPQAKDTTALDVDSAGDQIKYTLTLENTGNVEVDTIAVKDSMFKLNTGATAIRATDIEYAIDVDGNGTETWKAIGDAVATLDTTTGQLSFNNLTLGVNQNIFVRYNVLVTQDDIDTNGGGDGFIDNVASAKYDDVQDGSGTPKEALDKDPSDSDNEVSYKIPIIRSPEMTIAKTVTAVNLDGNHYGSPQAKDTTALDVDSAGDQIKYTLTLENTGNVEVDTIAVKDSMFKLNTGATAIRATDIEYAIDVDGNGTETWKAIGDAVATLDTTTGQLSFNNLTLGVNQNIFVRYNVLVTQDDIDTNGGGDGFIDNVASAKYDDVQDGSGTPKEALDKDPSDSDNEVSYKIPIIRSPEMTIAKTVTAVNLDGNHYGSPQAKDTTALDVDSAGDQIKYTLTLENTGNVEVDTIAVKDSMFKLNTGATAIRATDIEYAIDVDGNGTETWKAIGDAVATLDTTTGQLSFNNLTLGVNQNIFVRYNVLVTQDDIDTNGGGDGFIDNVASAKYDDVQDGSGTPKEALDKDPSDSDNEVSYKIPIIRSPEMTIAKTVTAVNLDGNHYGSPQAKDTTALDVDSAGDQIKYTLTLENTGNVEVDTIAVKDSMFKLNTGATAIRATDIEYAIDVDGNGTETWKAIGDAVATLDTTTGQLSFNNLTLGVNQNIFVRYNVLVTQDDIDTNGGGDGFIDNVASAKYDDVQDGSGTPKEALDKDPSDSDNEVSYKIPIIRSPEMTIAKTVTAVNLDGNHYGSPQAKDTTALDVDSAGDQIKYTLTLENTGNVEVDTIAVKDSMFKLNTGATAIRATDIEYAIDVDGNGTETWKAIGDAVATLDTTTGQLSFNNLTLGVNQNIFVRYNVLVTQDDIDTNGGGDGFIDNVASAKYDDVQDGSGTPKEALDKDPSDSDNEVSYKIPIIRSPEMTIAKTVTAVNLDGNHYGSPQAKDTTALDVDSAGDQIKYTLTLENTGNVEVDTIAVKDSMFKLNTGATAIRATDIEYAIDVDGNGTETWKAIGDAVATLDTTTGQLSFNNLTLGVNQNIFVRYNVLVTQDDIDTNGGGDGFIDNVASAKYDDVQDGSGTPKEALDKDPSDSDNEVSYKIPIIRSPEMTIAKHAVVTDNGDDDFGGSSSSGTTAAQLDAARAQLALAQEILAMELALPEGDQDSKVIEQSRTDIASAQQIIGLVDSAGDTITYTLTAENTGNVVLNNVKIYDTMFDRMVDTPLVFLDLDQTDNAALIFVDGNPATLVNNGIDRPYILIPSMEVGSSKVITYTYIVQTKDVEDSGVNTAGVSDGDGDIDNTANATASAPGQNSPVETNAVSYDVDVIFEPVGDVAIYKEADVTSVEGEGQTVNYKLTVTNEGALDLTNVQVTDKMFSSNLLQVRVFGPELPANGELLLVNDDWNLLDGVLTIDNLKIGQYAEITYIYEVDAADFGAATNIEKSILDYVGNGPQGDAPIDFGYGTFEAYVNKNGIDPYDVDGDRAQVYVNVDNTGVAVGVNAGVMSGDRNANSDHLKAVFRPSQLNDGNSLVEGASIVFTNSKSVEMSFKVNVGNRDFIGSIIISEQGAVSLREITGSLPNYERTGTSSFNSSSSTYTFSTNTNSDFNANGWSFRVTETAGPGGAQNKIYTLNFDGGNQYVNSFDFWVVGNTDDNALEQIKVVDVKFDVLDFGNAEISNTATVTSDQDIGGGSDEISTKVITVTSDLTVKDAELAIALGETKVSVKDTVDNIEKASDLLINKIKDTQLTVVNNDGRIDAEGAERIKLNAKFASVSVNDKVGVITLSDNLIQKGQLVTVTVEFSQGVKDLDLTDFAIERGVPTPNSLTSDDAGKVWSFTFTADNNIEDPTNIVTLNGQYRYNDDNSLGKSIISNNYAVDSINPVAPTVNALTTNDQTPTITGTATLGSGETLSVVVGSQTFSNVAVANNGQWSVTPTTDLAAGTYDVVATVRDAAGNTTVDSSLSELTIDITPPAVAPTVNALTTNDQTPTITGTATLGSGETLSVVVGSQTFSNVAVANNGQWSVTPTTDLAAGTYDVVATVRDAAGNTTVDSSLSELTIDITPPAVAPTVNALTTNDQTPTITGTATLGSGETLSVVVGSQTFSNVAVANNGQWSVTPTTDLAAGTYDVVATVRDAAGNTTVDSSLSELTIDITPPAVAPTVNALTTNDQTPTITGTATLGSGETLSVVVGSQTFSNVAVANNGQWSVTPTTNLAAGTYDVVATVRDAAGNTTVDSSLSELVVRAENDGVFNYTYSSTANLTTGIVSGLSFTNIGGVITSATWFKDGATTPYSTQSSNLDQITLTVAPQQKSRLYVLVVEVVTPEGLLTFRSDNITMSSSSGSIPGVIIQTSSPIILDLNGNGISYISQEAGVNFDYNNNGVAETTPWVAPEDGFLAMQREDGTHNIVFSTRAGETDLQGLAKVYDTNKDGIFDALDAEFAKFGVWQDADSDGIVDAGEFRSLADRGITSLSLTSNNQVRLEANGDVIVYGQTSYTMADGSTHLAEDVGFVTGNSDEPLDLAAIIANAEAIQSVTSIDQLSDTPSTSSLFVELGGQTYEIATMSGQEMGAQDILSSFVGADTSSSLLSDRSWTDIIDISSEYGGPGAILADGGSLTNDYANAGGDWTVIINSGEATVDAANKQITFASETANNSVTIVTADGVSHDIDNVDKIQWHG